MKITSSLSSALLRSHGWTKRHGLTLLVLSMILSVLCMCVLHKASMNTLPVINAILSFDISDGFRQLFAFFFRDRRLWKFQTKDSFGPNDLHAADMRVVGIWMLFDTNVVHNANGTSSSRTGEFLFLTRSENWLAERPLTHTQGIIAVTFIGLNDNFWTDKWRTVSVLEMQRCALLGAASARMKETIMGEACMSILVKKNVQNNLAHGNAHESLTAAAQLS